MTRVYLCLVLLVGCANPPPAVTPPVNDAHEPTTLGLPAGHPPAQSGTDTAAAHRGIAGEVLAGGGYTYVRIDSDGKQLWVAGPAADITVGQSVQAGQGSEMRDFESKTLARTFASIQFVPWVRAADAKGQPIDVKAPTEVEPVEPLSGGQTVAQLFAQKDALANKPVAVRGRVVKVTAGILGRTFLHIQDGTGSAADRTNDLTVTTNDPVEAGQLVVVRGTLITDKDFGAGYHYDVLIEEAKIGLQGF
jgi:hypothetical protein